MSKVRWGIIGTGSIANAFAHSIKHCNHSELISVFGRNKETLQTFSQKFDVAGINEIDELINFIYTGNIEFLRECLKCLFISSKNRN